MISKNQLTEDLNTQTDWTGDLITSEWFFVEKNKIQTTSQSLEQE